MLKSASAKHTTGAPVHGLFLVDSSVEQQLSSLGNVFRSAPVGLCVLDLTFRYVTVNPCFARMYRLGVDQFPGRTVEEALPGPAPQIMAHLLSVLETKQSIDAEINVMLPSLDSTSGELEELTYLRTAQPVYGNGSRVVGFTVSLLDITARRRAEAALRDSEDNLRYTVELSPHIPWTADASGELTYMSPRWTEMTGRKSDTVLLKDWAQAVNSADRAETIAYWRHSVNTGNAFDREYRVLCKNGTWRWLRARASPRKDAAGSVVCWYGTVEDVHERKLMEATIQKKTDELARRAQQDHLTGLANRCHFDDILEREIERARRSRLPLALVLIDVDRFKQYNDTWGHVAGDHCLRAVALALDSVIRRPGDLAARFGGEEFALILPDTSCEGAQEVARAASAAVNRLQISGSGGTSRHVTISAGVAMFNREAGVLGPNSALALIEAADCALYRSKAEGRNRVTLAPTF